MRIYVYSDCISESECKADKKGPSFMLPVVCLYLSVAAWLFCLLCKLFLLLANNSIGEYSSTVSNSTTVVGEAYF